jgi:ankyrin repeat protein
VDVDTKYRYDRTALSFACDRGHLEVVKVLLDHGANVNIRDTFYGATPLIWAARPAMARRPQHAEIVGLLLKHGAQGKEDAFASAVSAGDAAMVKVILDQGPLEAGVLSEALESAQKDKMADIVSILERAGAKPYIEFKIEEAQLHRYAGTYREPSGNEIILSVKDGKLTDGPPAQMEFMATDATTFRVLGMPGATLRFNLQEGKPAEVTFSRGKMKITYTRVEAK